VVGHEPDFSETLAALIGLPAPEHLSIRKASLTAIDLPRLAAGTGQLQYLLPVWLM
jgi:phosphohistidine phosphatase SixA